MLVNPKKAYQYFKNNFVLKKSSQNWWAFDDPFDPNGYGKKKMAVQFQFEVVKCWTYDYSVSIVKFVMDYENVDYHEARKRINECQEAAIDLDLLAEVSGEQMEKSQAYMPHGFTSILSGNGVLGKRARKYLEDRKFNLEELDSLGFGYCNQHAEEKSEDYFGYIIIPFFRKNLLHYYIGRDYVGNFLRYKNPPKALFGVGKSSLFYNEDAFNRHKTVYLTEGWADAATLGAQGVASLGWSLSKDQKSTILSSKVKEIVIVPDAGFYKQAIKTAMDFLDFKKVKVVEFDKISGYGKDANDVARNGKLDELLNLIESTKNLTLEKAVIELM